MLQKVLLSLALLSTMSYGEMRVHAKYPLSLHSVEYTELNSYTGELVSDTAYASREMVSDSTTNTLKESISTARYTSAGYFSQYSYYTTDGEWLEDVHSWDGRGFSNTETWYYDKKNRTAFSKRRGTRVPDLRSSSSSSKVYDESGLLLSTSYSSYYEAEMDPPGHSRWSLHYIYSENKKLDSIVSAKGFLYKTFHYDTLPEYEEITVKQRFTKGDSSWFITESKKLCRERDTTVVYYVDGSDEISRTVKTCYNENGQIIEVCSMDSTGDTTSLISTSYTDQGDVQEITEFYPNGSGGLQTRRTEKYNYNYNHYPTAIQTKDAFKKSSISPMISFSQGNMNILMLEGTAQNSILIITDLKGRIIRQRNLTFSQMNVDITSLASGVYCANIRTMGTVASLKFLKQ